jgi:hypothetical protein
MTWPLCTVPARAADRSEANIRAASLGIGRATIEIELQGEACVLPEEF